MNISDMINKSSPLYKQKEMSKSEYKKLVDRNTELIDKMKDLQNIIDKAIEYIDKHIRIDDEYPDYMEMLVEEKNELLNILKGEDKE